MGTFAVEFDLEPFNELDQLALLARQDYNLGGDGDWFGDFRGGLYGFGSRLFGVQRHYFDVHAWIPRPRPPVETEYHVASILFQMDSALECLVFAVNALGWAVLPRDFRDVTDSKALRNILPTDVIGKVPQPGYHKLFSTFVTLWEAQEQLISTICGLHNVSKHRRTIYSGGQSRMDPPLGFYESLGIASDSLSQVPFAPMAEIILMDEPALPSVQRKAKSVRSGELLEDLVPSFAALIKDSGTALLNDAKANVPLSVKQLQK